ncbi:MAG: hypothetical protein VX777_06545 [Chlamydiota bacterium]|nr:hypothetical protein [Chlamydiota bacterium]
MKTLSIIFSIFMLISSSWIYSNTPENDRVSAIEQEINLLKNDKKTLQSKAIELKTESYRVMMNDWEKYSQMLKKIESYNHMIDRINERIDELKSEKNKQIQNS